MKEKLIYGYGNLCHSLSVYEDESDGDTKKYIYRINVDGELIFVCYSEEKALLYAKGLEEGLNIGCDNDKGCKKRKKK